MNRNLTITPRSAIKKKPDHELGLPVHS